MRSEGILHDPRDPDDDRWSPWDGDPVHIETDSYDFTPAIGDEHDRDPS